uniref:Uncharacterized protein n=1 Tax=uncultured Desulfobacterium sp. TaxID=201089 RepID=E1YCW8_9BACT|nr:unknown protein [uncultured Desulfobacterium sp.]
MNGKINRLIYNAGIVGLVTHHSTNEPALFGKFKWLLKGGHTISN